MTLWFEAHSVTETEAHLDISFSDGIRRKQAVSNGSVNIEIDMKSLRRKDTPPCSSRNTVTYNQ